MKFLNGRTQYKEDDPNWQKKMQRLASARNRNGGEEHSPGVEDDDDHRSRTSLPSGDGGETFLQPASLHV